MLTDTGAFCNCVSYDFYKTWLCRTTPLSPNPAGQEFTSANNSALNVLGWIEIPVKIGGRETVAHFQVIDQLSQGVILGVPYLQSTGAVLDFDRKRISLYGNAVTLPLLTSTDDATAIRTIKRVRIPANHEMIIPVRLPRLPGTLAITETLPQTLRKGIKVASALIDCDRRTSMCRIANPTRRPIVWKAGHAFAYASPLPQNGAGVNLINMSDCFDTTPNANEGVCTINEHCEQRDDENDATESGERTRNPPCHEARLSAIHKLGIKLSTDLLNTEQAERLSSILYEYRDVMAENYVQVPEARVPRHRIPLINDKPCIQKRFRYDPVKEEKLESLCDELLEAGIIKESTSLWNSPVFLITKPDGSSRFLVDFRAVNAQTKALFCALPSIEDIFDQIAEEKPRIFTVADLKAGYYGVGLEESSQPCTAFSTKRRHFQFCRLNMGYVNSGSFFTETLYKLFASELRHHMILYVDDLFLLHHDIDEHIDFLEKLLAKFREYNLRLHPKKMHVATSTANFLGYTLTQDGYTVDTGRCKIIKNYPRPRNPKDVKKFLGISSYFRRLIKNYSQRSAPLRELLSKDKHTFQWTEAQEKSFCDIRDQLCKAPTLGYPDRNKPLRIILDACATGLGYILVNVSPDGTETPLYYGGRSTTKAEKNYSATELELAALLTAVKTYSSYISNCEFDIVTDHISLTYIKNLRFGPSKLVRASLLLNQYKFKIIHILGRHNTASDSISRTTNLQTDPLTEYEAARFQADKDLDLCLDGWTATDGAFNNSDAAASSDKTFSDAAIQCDLVSAERDRHVQTVHTERPDRPTQDDTQTTSSQQTPMACVQQAGGISDTGNIPKNESRSPNPHNYGVQTGARALADDRQAERSGPRACEANSADSGDADVNIAIVTAAKRRRPARTHTTHGRTRAASKVSHSSDRPSVNDTPRSENANNNTQHASVDSRCNSSTPGSSGANATTPAHTAHNVTSSMQRASDIGEGAGRDHNSGDSTGVASSAQAGSPTDATDGATDTDSPPGPDITLQLQKTDPQLGQIIEYLQNGTLPTDDKTARRICITSEQYAILNGKLCHLGTQRHKRNQTDQPIIEQVCIPSQLQPAVIAQYHEQLLHCGYEKLYLSIKQRAFWDQMYSDIRRYVAECHTCKRGKTDNHPIKAPLHCRDVPQLFQRVHIDHLQIKVKGTKHGFTHVLVIVDAMSLCCELIAVKNTSAAETCRALITGWIARYGCFSELVSDRHKSFTGKLTQLLAQWCGIKHVLISSHHSRANGQCERLNGVILQGLRIICQGRTDWPDLLPQISAAYKASVLPSRGYSPFRILYGQEMKLPVETALSGPLPAHTRPSSDVEQMSEHLKIMRTNAQELAQKCREKHTKRINKRRQTVTFKPGDRVYKVREVLGDTEDRKTAPRFIGPFVILDKDSNDTYQLAHLHTGRILKSRVHVDKLKSTANARTARRQATPINTINTHKKHTVTSAPQKRGAGCTVARPRPGRRNGQSALTEPPEARDHPLEAAAALAK